MDLCSSREIWPIIVPPVRQRSCNEGWPIMIRRPDSLSFRVRQSGGRARAWLWWQSEREAKWKELTLALLNSAEKAQIQERRKQAQIQETARKLRDRITALLDQACIAPVAEPSGTAAVAEPSRTAAIAEPPRPAAVAEPSTDHSSDKRRLSL